MSTTLPTTHTEAEALYKAAGKVLSKPKKVEDKLSLGLSRTKTNSRRLGVMSITKQENVQLGLILRHLSYQKRYLKLPEDVILYPEAFEKLCGRYS